MSKTNEEEKARVEKVLNSVNSTLSGKRKKKCKKEIIYCSDIYDFSFEFDTAAGKTHLHITGFLRVKVKNNYSKLHAEVEAVLTSERMRSFRPLRNVYKTHPYKQTQEYESRVLYNVKYGIKEEITIPKAYELQEGDYILSREECEKYYELQKIAKEILKTDPIIEHYEEVVGSSLPYKEVYQELREKIVKN